MEKIRKLKTMTFLLFFVSIYFPIYNFTFLGAPVSANVFDIRSPLIILLPVLLTAIFGLLTVQFFVRLEKIASYVGLGVMAIILLFFGIAINAGETFGLAFYLIVLCILLLVVTTFLPDIAIKGYDAIAQLWDKLVQMLRQEPLPQEPEVPDIPDTSDVEEVKETE